MQAHVTIFDCTRRELDEASGTTSTTSTCTMKGDLRLGVSSCSLYDSAETVVFISGVFNNTGGSVGLNQAVGALDHVAVTGLPLALNVTSVRVVNGVVEFIVRRPLINKSTLYK
jgi:hypothetical protein